MKQTKRKLLSGILTAALLLQTVMPTMAFAAEGAPKTIVGISSLEQTAYTLEIGADETASSDLLATFPKTITATAEYIVTEEVIRSPVVDSGKPEQPEEPPVTEEAVTDSNASEKDEGIAEDKDIATDEEITDDKDVTLVEKTKTEKVNLAVTWESDKEFSTEKTDSFIYTAKLGTRASTTLQLE